MRYLLVDLIRRESLAAHTPTGVELNKAQSRGILADEGLLCEVGAVIEKHPAFDGSSSASVPPKSLCLKTSLLGRFKFSFKLSRANPVPPVRLVSAIIHDKFKASRVAVVRWYAQSELSFVPFDNQTRDLVQNLESRCYGELHSFGSHKEDASQRDETFLINTKGAAARVTCSAWVNFDPTQGIAAFVVSGMSPSSYALVGI